MQPQTAHDPAHWHSLSPEQASERLDSPDSGLASPLAQQRLQAHGPNRLPEPPRPSALRRLLLQFHNVLLYLMLASTLVTALLGHWIDSGVIFAAVLVNVVIGFIQEGKAESAMDAIRSMLSPHALVIRDGQRMELDAADLVPGDRVLLASGDRVPADLRLLQSRNLRIDEAPLTGESEPVDKHPAALPDATVLAERRCMAYSGTLVTSGQAQGLVVATAEATELGRIGALLQQVEAQTTPLLRQIAAFSRWLALVIVAVGALTFALGTLWRGQGAADMFIMVVALTAAAIPEGMPAIITVILALGVQRMAAQRAIVRRLPAVETLGSVTVICSDKTGTLTRNEMTVQRLVSAARVIEVSGVGYAPEGGFALAGRPCAAQQLPGLERAAQVALLCNDAHLNLRDGDWQLAGDPTEGALLTLALKAGLEAETLRSERPRLDAIPFESEHRFMATLHHDHHGGRQIFLKGAPERLLEMCRWQAGDAGEQPLDPDYWRRQAADLAARGLRVLALAERAATPGQSTLDMDEVQRDGVLLALVGIIDPPRAEAVAAVAECRRAGVQVKMITGDHAETARAIGAQLGIGAGGPALTGAEVEVLDDEALARVLPQVDVFARASPEHKLRLVEALQRSGAVVAMTGDGVNDAPALKRADVGVAMGHKGTEAAKEAAEVVLGDDNFATITHAVREGRAVYDNLKKSILFMLPTNGGQALTVIVAILLGVTLPLSPAQVLWVNMVTSATLCLALAFEPHEAGLMHRAPRAPSAPLLDGPLVWRVLLVSLLIMGAALGLFLWELQRGASLESARTLAVNAVVACEMGFLISCRRLHAGVLGRQALSGNRMLLLTLGACVLLQLAYTYAPPFQALFDSTALGLGEWLRILAVGVLVLLLVEADKALSRRRSAR